MRRRTVYLGMIAVLALTVASSCGQKTIRLKGELPVARVEGKLLMNGEPMPDAEVFFHPVEAYPEGAAKVRPHATTDEDGSFQVTTYRLGDGAPVGDYRVTVSWKGALTSIPGDDDTRPERVPARYRDPRWSNLKAQVQKGNNSLPAWDLGESAKQASAR